MTLACKLGLDAFPLDLHVKIQVCPSAVTQKDTQNGDAKSITCITSVADAGCNNKLRIIYEFIIKLKADRLHLHYFSYTCPLITDTHFRLVMTLFFGKAEALMLHARNLT